MIPVTKPYLPSREKLDKYIDGIYEREWLTNNGPLVQELTKRLEEYLGVENLLLVSNGTLALQIAYRVLGVSTTNRDEKPEAITTPFTFIATASSLKWEGVEPVFADIHPDTWCLDPAKIEAAITSQTRAFVPVHVYGNACDVENIDLVAQKHDLKVIYDAAHAFGVNYKGESLLKWGDAATLSFHATKVFHTVEGGAVVFKRKEDLETAKRMINFGITGPEKIETIGINAKMNEFQAAMGLAMLDDVEAYTSARRLIFDCFFQQLSSLPESMIAIARQSENCSYFPILLPTEAERERLQRSLTDVGIGVRRYFSPALNTLPEFSHTERVASEPCPYAEDIAARLLCIPVFPAMTDDQMKYIVKFLLEFLVVKP